MRQELNDSLANHKKLGRELLEAQLAAAAATREAKVHREKLEGIGKNVQNLSQEYEKACARIKEYERMETQWKNSPKVAHRNRQEQDGFRRQSQIKSYTSESCQTEWRAQ